MPKYRQLHTKMVDSEDIANMPDDFTRFFFVTLIIVLDSAGRAIDNPAWLRSKAFPMRSDVEIKQVSDALDWLAEHNHIIRYEVDGKKYFYCPKFLELQTGLDKEGPSVLPAPELLRSNSEPTPEKVGSSSASIQYNAINNTKQSKSIQSTENSKKSLSPSEKELKAWNMALGDLLLSGISKAHYEAWVEPLSLQSVKDGVFTAKAANEYAAGWVRNRIVPAMNNYLTAQSGHQAILEVIV